MTKVARDVDPELRALEERVAGYKKDPERFDRIRVAAERLRSLPDEARLTREEAFKRVPRR
jgi:hypothetical protein